jgi:predicted RND superfamily exporter protein
VAVEGGLSFRPGSNRKELLERIDLTPAEADQLIGAGIDNVRKLLNTPADAELVGISHEEWRVFRDKAKRWEKTYGIDLWRISLRVWSLKKDIDYALFIQDVKDVIEPIVAETNLENDVRWNLSFLPGDDRAKNLAQLGFSTHDAELLTKAKIDNVQTLIDIPEEIELDKNALAKVKLLRKKAIQWVNDHGAVQAVYTGMVPVVYKTQHELYGGLVWSFIMSFFMIGVAMGVVLRSASAGFLVMIPNVFPVFIVFGFMGHFGVLVDIGTMMTASVALGIATDDTIHFLTWFRHGMDQGMSRAEATRHAYSRSASAIVQTTLIAGFGLAAFALSTFTPTQMFGIMMLVILVTATLGDLIFLAAILNTPVGRIFEPKKKKT